MSIKNVISKNGVWKTAPLNDSSSSGGGVPYVTATFDSETNKETLDKTWSEIKSGMIFMIVTDNPGSMSIRYIDGVITNQIYGGAKSYNVIAGDVTYSATSKSGYPYRNLQE